MGALVMQNVVLGKGGARKLRRGKAQPVTLDVDFHGAGVGMNKKETVGFEAETTIKRSDFGVSMGIPYVSDAVELEIHAAFEKQ